MNSLLLNFVLAITILCSNKGISQTIDTLVDVGGYKLHFNVTKGKGIPILFEAGAGADGTIWSGILKPIADITDATLITYDRAGFGKSDLDTNKHGIINGIEGLESGLKKLGYDKDILLVASSYGGFYVTLYASRHPSTVKAVVMIDACLVCYFANEGILAAITGKENLEQSKRQSLGLYYLMSDYRNTVDLMSKAILPANIPVIDLVGERFFLEDSAEAERWKNCHKQFTESQPNREALTAYRCGHVIFLDNPPLVISAIVKAYSGVLENNQSNEVLKRGLAYSFQAINELKRDEDSENNINYWGYWLLYKGEIQKALEVFKLNISLYPSGWNVYDSYGEALLKNGQKEEAINMYKKSVELNPNNENGLKVLEQLSKQ